MGKIIISLYDYLKRKPFMALGIFLLLTVSLILSVMTLSYKEDISDFLPMDENNKTALAVYQDVSGANKIYAIVSHTDTASDNPQQLADGVEEFVANVKERDSLNYISNIIKQIDLDKMTEVMGAVYSNIPYFLTDNDYRRIDSLLSLPDYIPSRIEEDKQILMFPSSNMLLSNMASDPLNMFSPVLGRLKHGGVSINFESYDGYILSPDGKKAIVILDSSFGASESEHNADLVSMLNNAIGDTKDSNPDVNIHIIGGPVIAVENAGQIKTDSILAVVIAGVLILTLLIYVFRNLRNIVLIFVSVGWGWLFAMGGIALYYDSVSIIVIGIASVILGIAVNYPLHLIDHLKDSSRPRAALKEIISPLVVGNITTVGAFLCLVPLNSPALHDLGLFASLLLVGTIIFVLVFLPHIVKTKKNGNKEADESSFISRIADISLENNRWVVWSVLLLTVVFGYFSVHTEFDSDMRNINYMTTEQKSDMAYFQGLVSESTDTESLYVVSNGKNWEEALRQNELINEAIDSLVANGLVVRRNNVSDFFVSSEQQRKRLVKWKDFVDRYKKRYSKEFNQAVVEQGFNPEAFSSFNEILNRNYAIAEFDDFKGIISNVFVGAVSTDEKMGRRTLVQVIEVPADSMENVKTILSRKKEFGGLFFDVKGMNGSIANTLSDDFNYIGLACGLIVFVFLWISLGRIELAIVSFLPMAFSWVWILGIMSIFGIKFNIVNVILATFIFGQGDDYTIFMTEGLSYEYAYRRKLLASYKSSIVVSALIMFIGIGTLLFAKHPALRSLGEVTVVGMLSVVLMAYLFPPLVFNWLVKKNGKVRRRPITLKKLLFTGICTMVFLVQLSSAYILGFFLFVLTKPTAGKRELFHRYNCSVFRFDIRRMPGINLIFKNENHEDFSTPSIIICNHQSLLDSFCLMSITPKIILLANDHIKSNPIVGTIFKWNGFLTVGEGSEHILDKIKNLVAEGYSIAVFPEGERSDDDDTRIRRFHKGAFFMSENLGLDIVPVFLSGVRQIMPKGSAISNGGTMYIEIGKRLSHDELVILGGISDQAKAIRLRYMERLKSIDETICTVKELIPLVYDRYIYKGEEIERKARHVLRGCLKCKESIEYLYDTKQFVVHDCAGQGELAVLLSLMYPQSKVCCIMESVESKEILRGTMEGFTPDIRIVDKKDVDTYIMENTTMVVVVKDNSRDVHYDAEGVVIYV